MYKNGNFGYFSIGDVTFLRARQKTFRVDVEECVRKKVEGLPAPARSNFASRPTAKRHDWLENVPEANLRTMARDDFGGRRQRHACRAAGIAA